MDAAVSQHLGEAMVGALVVVKQIADLVGGRAKDRRHATANEELRGELAAQFGKLSDEIRDVRHFVIGPDGKNGVRGDLRKAEARIGDLEQRERESFLRPREVGEYRPPRRE